MYVFFDNLMLIEADVWSYSTIVGNLLQNFNQDIRHQMFSANWFYTHLYTYKYILMIKKGQIDQANEYQQLFIVPSLHLILRGIQVFHENNLT